MFAKNLLVSNIEEFFSPFLAAYRKSYSTQHVLIRMVEEWKENLDNNFIVGAVLTDLSKAFDCIPHDLLIAKLSAYGLNSDSLCYIYSHLKDHKQCVQINNKQSGFYTIISGASLDVRDKLMGRQKSAFSLAIRVYRYSQSKNIISKCLDIQQSSDFCWAVMF